jgi:uncharacterized membrane protein
MTERISNTSHADAPLSAAYHPDARGEASDIAAEQSDALIGYTVCINRPRPELYAFWRNFSNLPRFMENVRAVAVLDPLRSHWTIAAPGDRTVEWTSQITNDLPNERIAWASLEGADVRNSGAVSFRDAPNGRGTFVTVTIAYDPPAGGIGRLVAKLFHREPKIQARQDLRRFKQLMETGEIPTARGAAAAPRG